MNNGEKILAALCYFSVLFAPFLLPLIVYFVAGDKEVSYHARKAFVSHLVPFISILLVVFFLFGQHVGWIIGAFILFGVLNFVIFIWNIVKGIQVLRW
ncbi:DUF4870 domain-containing protein [Pseudalkalibacillus caeni]